MNYLMSIRFYSRLTSELLDREREKKTSAVNGIAERYFRDKEPLKTLLFSR